MKTTSTFLHTFCTFLVLNLAFVSFLASQTYDLSAERARWQVSIDDSLSSLPPDSVIRLIPLVQNEDATLLPSNGDISTNSVTSGQTHSHIPTSVTIDTSKDVGEIPFSSSTSPSGGVVYNVPIDISSGRNGCQPQISVAYNSQGGNDVIGFGWTIGGLSAISRAPKNIYYNGQVSPITLGTDDAFTLDGIRLLSTGEANTYELEQGNARVRAYLSGGAISYFIVEYPDGSKGTFTSKIVYPDKNPCKERFIPASQSSHSRHYYESEFAPEQNLAIYQSLDGNTSVQTTLMAEAGFQALLSADIDGKPGEELLKINEIVKLILLKWIFTTTKEVLGLNISQQEPVL